MPRLGAQRWPRMPRAHPASPVPGSVWPSLRPVLALRMQPPHARGRGGRERGGAAAQQGLRDAWPRLHACALPRRRSGEAAPGRLRCLQGRPSRRGLTGRARGAGAPGRPAAGPLPAAQAHAGRPGVPLHGAPARGTPSCSGPRAQHSCSSELLPRVTVRAPAQQGSAGAVQAGPRGWCGCRRARAEPRRAPSLTRTKLNRGQLDLCGAAGANARAAPGPEPDARTRRARRRPA